MKFGNVIVLNSFIDSMTDDEVLKMFKDCLVTNARQSVGSGKKVSIRITRCDPKDFPEVPDMKGTIKWRSDHAWEYKFTT